MNEGAFDTTKDDPMIALSPVEIAAALDQNAAPAPVSADGEIADLRRVVAELQREVVSLHIIVANWRSYFDGKLP